MTLRHLPLEVVAELGLIVLLILASAFLYGARWAIFALKSADLSLLQRSYPNLSRRVMYLNRRPRLLQATILSAQVFLAAALGVIFYDMVQRIGNGIPVWETTLLFIAILACMIILTGQLVHRIMTALPPLSIAIGSARFMFILSKALYPVSLWLAKAAPRPYREDTLAALQSHLAREGSADNLPGSVGSREERKILRGVINFGNTYVRQIMRPRADIVAHDKNISFTELVRLINENRYSRVPVYEGNPDRIIGILYIKDLLPYLGENANFRWPDLLRQPYFVPEAKKIDLLLQEFKRKRVHMAIVVDEYGGTSGIVTLEDILEEIVGDIHDEFDEEDVVYSMIDKDNYIFDGKTSLSDVTRIMEIEEDIFNGYRGEAETIGGLIIAITGTIPPSGHAVEYNTLRILVDLADRRRIRRVKISRLSEVPSEI